MNAEITGVSGCSTTSIEVEDSVEEISVDEEEGNIVGGSINVNDNVNITEQENNLDELKFDVSDNEFNFNNKDE